MFNSPSVDDLRNGFNSTSTSNSTFKDLSQILDEDCKDTEPIIDEPVETDRGIIITVEEKINKKRKK